MRKIKVPSIQKQRSEETKQKILAAFISLLREKDFDHITTKEICTLAGVSNGSFFHHFGEKSALLGFYMDNAYTQYVAQRDWEISQNPYIEFLNQDAWTNQFMRPYGIDFLRNYYSPKNHVVATHGDEDRPMNYTSPFMEETLKAAGELIRREWVKPGMLAEQIEADYHSIRHGIIFDWCACGGTFRLEKATRRMLLIYFRGISTPAGLKVLDGIEGVKA